MKRIRPETPHVIIGDTNSSISTSNSISTSISNVNVNQNNDLLFKNFSNFMRQIVDSENEKFLNGDINVIDYVLAKYLRININDLKHLRKLSIKINGSYGLLNQFGQRLVELKCLKLNDSFIPEINDLGSNFKNIIILQMNNCRLKELSGIVCFEFLEVFEAKNNEISDLIELEMCTSIKKLNLSNNLIEKEENIYFLSSLDNLVYVNLSGNPIKNYDKKLKELLPNLKEIDIEKDICQGYESIIDNNININNNTNVNNNNIENENDNLKKTVSGNADEEIEIVDNNNNIIQDLMESKTKFDFHKAGLSELQPVKDLKPVITKRRESKDIINLRESFNRESPDKKKGKILLSNNPEKKSKNMFNSGIKTLKDIKNKNMEKIYIKSKNTNNNTNDKFLEELRARRLNGK